MPYEPSDERLRELGQEAFRAIVERKKLEAEIEGLRAALLAAREDVQAFLEDSERQGFVHDAANIRQTLDKIDSALG